MQTSFGTKRVNGTKAKAAKKARTTGGQVSSTIAKTPSLYLEQKFIDSTRTSTAFTTAWASLQPTSGIVDCLTCPAIGDTESSRDGRVYFIRGISVRGIVTLPAVEGTGSPADDIFWRIALVWDTQTNSVAIPALSVMDAGATNDVLSFRNLANSKRFIILGDTQIQVIHQFQMAEAVDLFSNGRQIFNFSFYKTFKEGIKVRCTNTTANVGSVSDNSFSLIGLASNTALSMEYETRCRFTG